MTVIIDGVKYVPEASIPPLEDGALLTAIRELVGIQYWSGQRHKHRAWAWDALNALAPELAEMCSDDPKAAYERVHPEDD